jgi:hypothetical protein
MLLDHLVGSRLQAAPQFPQLFVFIRFSNKSIIHNTESATDLTPRYR